jgi:hypothetical protein
MPRRLIMVATGEKRAKTDVVVKRRLSNDAFDSLLAP